MQSVVRRGVIISTVLVFSALALFASSGVAAAASRDGNCDVGEFCVFDARQFGGAIFDTSGTDTNYSDNVWSGRIGDDTPNSPNNHASSVDNRETACTVTVYGGAWQTGAHEDFIPGDEDGDLGNNDIGINTISGHKTC